MLLKVKTNVVAVSKSTITLNASPDRLPSTVSVPTTSSRVSVSLGITYGAHRLFVEHS